MKQKTKLSKIREGLDMSIYELAQRSDVSFEKCRQLDMGYRVNTTSYLIKEKISHTLGKNPWEVFDDVKEEIRKLMKDMDENNFPEIARGYHELVTLRRFVYDFHSTPKQNKFFRDVFSKMDDEELGEIYQSGMTMERVIQIMKDAAKKYKIKIPQSLKG